MADRYGPDLISMTDEDGIDYELEVLSTLEYNGSTYLAVLPAGDSAEQLRMEVTIFKSVEENGAPVLCFIEDEAELETVNSLMIDAAYEDSE